jgi:hypothetical protein
MNGVKVTGREVTVESGQETRFRVNYVAPSSGTAEKTKKDQALEPTAAIRPTIPADARAFSGKHYKLFTEQMSWHEARDQCKQMGGHLVIVKNESENNFVRSLLDDARLGSAWLGATDEKVEGKWVWVDGSEMTYANWNDGQPNNVHDGRDENYLIMVASRVGTWWDYLEFDRIKVFQPGFVCQWDDNARVGTDQRDFVPLFNGKDFAGWSAWDNGGPLSMAEASKIWSVRDGVLIGTGRQSHLFSPRGDYNNFRVRAEVKINDTGNSGLYFRAPKGPGLPAGYEAQIICTRNESRNIGALYGANAPGPAVPSSLPRPDTWFAIEAEAVGNRIQVWIEGQKTIDWTDPQNSYFSGHFAIQVIDEQTQIQVRKFEVMELP